MTPVELAAWAEEHLTPANIAVGKVITVTFRGTAAGLQLVVREHLTLSPQTVALTFAVCLYGVMTGKEVYATRINNVWKFSSVKV